MARVETRWATALLGLSHGAEDAARCGALLAQLAKTVAENGELKTFLENPTLPHAAKRDALAKLTPQNAPAYFLHFLYLLVDKGRVKHLGAISAAFERLRAAKGGECFITVTSAMPLEDAQLQRIGRLFSRRCGAAGAVVKPVVQPGLIGGVRVQVGDVLYDESLLGRTQGLRRAIAAEGARAQGTD